MRPVELRPDVEQQPALRIYRGAERLDSLSPHDRSFCYGDGLFETIRVIAGRPVLMAEHWARLSVGCELLGLPDESIWRAHTSAFLADRRDGILRMHVSAGSGGRGYGRPSPCQPILVLQWFDEPLQAPSAIRIGEASLALAEQPALAGIKHASRLEQVLLRRELSAMPGCREAVVYDQSGRVVEGVFSNLFFVRNGQLHTPALSRCGVRGVLREALLSACAEQALPVCMGDFRRDDLLSADSIFFVNSVNGLWPVTQWHDKAWRIDAITRQCQAIIAPWFASS